MIPRKQPVERLVLGVERTSPFVSISYVWKIIRFIFARFGLLDRYYSMEANKQTRIRSRGSQATSFLNGLRTDHRFLADAKRNGLIGVTALVLAVGMFYLARSGLVHDANTFDVVIFTSITTTLVFISAVIGFAIRIGDELLRYAVDQMK